MESHFGLYNVWAQGDWVTRGVALLLLGMSLATWMVILFKALDIVRYKKLARQAETFWHSADLAEGLNRLGPPEDNPFRALAEEGRDHATARLQSGLAVLASVGSTAPFVGLFGTVWGIYHALLSIGMAGQATIDRVAGPIGEALIMTALGLAVAIPAVLGYNALVRGNKAILGTLNSFAHDLHAYFVTGARVGGNEAKVVPMKKA